MIAKNCKNCKYAMSIETELFCHVNGPRAVKLRGVDRLEYPQVEPSHWCHKWRPSPDLVEGRTMTRGQ